MSCSARAAVMKHHRLGDLNNKSLFLRGQEVQDQVPADVVSGEGLLRGLLMATFSHGGERDSSYNGAHSIMGAHLRSRRIRG